MSIKNRPYVGSWEMGTQSVVRYTPDAKVMINGHTELAVCATCGHKTDFNKFITTISVDASTDPVSSCSVTLAVPRHEADVFSHDGNYVLQPGLEVVVLMRGYYPVTGYAMKGQEAASEGEGDDNVPVYPYYQVFRGVVTEATHEFSGGFYSCSLTCSSILHFWQYLYLSTNGSVFGAKPQDGGGIGIDLTGHRFTGMSPYGIMYTLMRVGFGAAFGVNWTISQATNIAAVDDATGKSLYKHAALWWEKRWAESSMRFRMYGMDGSLFNAMEQSYLGIFASGQTNASSFLTSFNIAVPDDNNWENTANRAATARAFGYRGAETSGAVLDDEGAKLDAMKMQAYTLDLGRLGQVNFFDGEYMSKMEIANAVKEIIGYEFYQDVDGDVVFKPPFYNLDTSSDEVYCIRDRDLISISESEREPEATYVKGSGSLFQNFQGILSGEFGTREAKFADWRKSHSSGGARPRLSHYYSGSKQMFIGAIMRLDVANAEMRSAQITVPMRPELRPGYPCGSSTWTASSTSRPWATPSLQGQPVRRPSQASRSGRSGSLPASQTAARGQVARTSRASMTCASTRRASTHRCRCTSSRKTSTATTRKRPGLLGSWATPTSSWRLTPTNSTPWPFPCREGRPHSPSPVGRPTSTRLCPSACCGVILILLGALRSTGWLWTTTRPTTSS